VVASIAHVGTYPPTRCGIATFTAALSDAVRSSEPWVLQRVVACVEEPGAVDFPAEVVAELVAVSEASRDEVVAALDGFDAVILQHEYGIYGGEDGDEVLDLVTRLRVPLIAVLHTVPGRPTPGQREVLEQLCAAAAEVVVLSRSAQERLLALYDVDGGGVHHIPHGATPNFAVSPHVSPRAPRTVLTWGLIGPGKGIEWGIEAIGLLRDLDPPVRYLIAGQTHPKVVRRCGSAYHDALVALADRVGVGELVTFDDRYLDKPALLALVRQADVILLPYESREQVVSGVLVDAICSGKPVVATRFPHAVELLGKGLGLLVPHEDPVAIADALRALFDESGLAERLVRLTRDQACPLAWSSVGHAFASLVQAAADRPVGLAR